jgi:hypothetical protein
VRPTRMKASDFLRGAYAAGIRRCGMTFVGYHPYVINYFCPTTNRNMADSPGIRELHEVRRVMVGRRDAAKRIWNTEWGFPSHPFITQRAPTYRECFYSSAKQAELVGREHRYLLRLGYMRFSIYFNIKDSWPDGVDPKENAFFTIGMLRRRTWERKPSFGVWTRLP